MAELRTKVYSKELEKKLYTDNSFVKKGSKHPDKLAASAKSLSIAQSGTVGKAKIGQPAQLPMPIKTIEDSSLDIAVYPVIAPAVLVDNESEVTTNYDKRSDYQEQQAEGIDYANGEIAATEWGPNGAALIKATTGTGRATNVTGLTNNRKAVTKNDLIAISSIFRRFNLRKTGGLYALLTEDAYQDILKIEQFVDYDKTGNTSKLEQGILGKILGFEVMTRNNDFNYNGLLYSSANAKRAVETIGANSDLPANLFFAGSAVTYVKGHIGSSILPMAGTAGGKVLEAWTRFGAGRKREDEKGVVALLEATV